VSSETLDAVWEAVRHRIPVPEVDHPLLHRPLIRNTYFGGGEPNGDALLSDIVFPSHNKYWNSLFSFVLCVDGGDFDFADVKELLTSVDARHLPALVVLLDKGIVTYGKMEERGLAPTSYPSDVQDGYDWCFFHSRFGEGGSLEGAHLARYVWSRHRPLVELPPRSAEGGSVSGRRDDPLRARVVPRVGELVNELGRLPPIGHRAASGIVSWLLARLGRTRIAVTKEQRER